jgi:phosphohistidine phosphatase SixA
MATPWWCIGRLPLGLDARTHAVRVDILGRRRGLGGLAAGLLLAAGMRPLAAAPEPAQVLLLRHARTEPGVGDPPGFRLDACGTQRQLSDEGRGQARRLGERLRRDGWVPQEVLSSRWCRCLDTGREAFGTVQPWTALDSFFEDRGREPAQTAALRRALAEIAPGRRVAWVTHMVNIQALTGEGVAMGEGLLISAGGGGWRVLRRVAAE